MFYSGDYIMKVLFWNTNNNAGKIINNVISELIVEYKIALVILAEYKANIIELLGNLNKKGIAMRPYPTSGCERITVIGEKMDIEPGSHTDYASFQIVNKRDIYCCVHLPSRIYNNSLGMREIAIDEILQNIQSIEKELGSNNTIVVGDFNSNPFDSECINANSFHGIPVFDDASKEKRTIANNEFKMFYNPMWSFFGDMQKPYGTYYYSGNNINNIFWHIYDQVIIRPSLRNRFVTSSLKILTDTSTQCLLNHLKHPDKNISDHLPLLFEIKEDKHG